MKSLNSGGAGFTLTVTNNEAFRGGTPSSCGRGKMAYKESQEEDWVGVKGGVWRKGCGRRMCVGSKWNEGRSDEVTATLYLYNITQCFSLNDHFEIAP